MRPSSRCRQLSFQVLPLQLLRPTHRRDESGQSLLLPRLLGLGTVPKRLFDVLLDGVPHELVQDRGRESVDLPGARAVLRDVARSPGIAELRWVLWWLVLLDLLPGQTDAVDEEG